MPQVTGFSASDVPTMLTNLEAKWADARANQNKVYTADTVLLNGIVDEQTADLVDDLQANDGCKPVKVVWLESGNHDVTEWNDQAAIVKTSVTCDLDGPEAASNAVEYYMNDAVVVTMKVKVADCGNQFTADQKFQQMMLSKMVDLENKMATKATQFMAASAGVNLGTGVLGTYAGDGSTDALKKQLRVAPGNFNAFDFAPYVDELAEINRLANPSVFDGGNLRYSLFNAEYQQNTPAGDAGQQKHFDTVRAVYRDGRNFTKAGLINSTFIVDRGALAFFTGSFFPTAPVEVSGDNFKYTQFRTPLMGLKQVGNRTAFADTTYKIKLLPTTENPAVCELYHVWEMRLWYLLLLNPQLSAGDGVTGVIRIVKDATLTQKGTAMQKPL